MLTIFELDRLLKMIDEYCYFMTYAISNCSVWVDMWSGENDVYIMQIIKGKLENELNNRTKHASAQKDGPK